MIIIFSLANMILNFINIEEMTHALWGIPQGSIEYVQQLRIY